PLLFKTYCSSLSPCPAPLYYHSAWLCTSTIGYFRGNHKQNSIGVYSIIVEEGVTGDGGTNCYWRILCCPSHLVSVCRLAKVQLDCIGLPIYTTLVAIDRGSSDGHAPFY